jgi:hypothetical protein
MSGDRFLGTVGNQSAAGAQSGAIVEVFGWVDAKCWEEMFRKHSDSV